MLSIEHLTVYRGGCLVLEDVSFVLPKGQLTAVLGLNGAGKTTLLKALLGFCPRAAGVITADGHTLDRMSPANRAKKLAYVPQRYDGGFQHSVEDFVSMGVTAYLGFFSRPSRDNLCRAKEILHELGCGHLVSRPMNKLSGGECKMAYLARAMMQDAGYLLLDEPVSSLDFSRQHTFLGSLRDYIARHQAGCLLTVHAPELAYAYADRILMIHDNALLLDLNRRDTDYEERLAAGLRQMYGSGVLPRFLDRTLILGWKGLSD